MKITDNGIPKEVKDVYYGNKPVKAIYWGDKKIWPTNSSRVTAIIVDVELLAGTLDGVLWKHALKATESGVSPSKFIKFKCGREYYINTAIDSRPVAYYMGKGELRFANGDGPMSSDAKIGSTIDMRLVIPQIESGRIGGNQSNTDPVSLDYISFIPGTVVRGYFGKGEKRTSSGVGINVKSYPSQIIVLDKHRQKDGHCRGDYDWEYGTVGFLPGEGHVTLSVSPHQPRGSWGGYFSYPSLDAVIRVKILKIETSL